MFEEFNTKEREVIIDMMHELSIDKSKHKESVTTQKQRISDITKEISDKELRLKLLDSKISRMTCFVQMVDAKKTSDLTLSILKNLVLLLREQYLEDKERLIQALQKISRKQRYLSFELELATKLVSLTDKVIGAAR